MAATQAAEGFKRNFSTKAFVQGLAVVALLWVLILLWAYLSADRVIEAQQEKLASQTVIIEWQGDMPEKTASTSPYDAHSEQTHEDGEEHTDEETPPPVEYKPLEIMESGLVEAPIDGLYEESTFGRRPAIREHDGLTPYKAYKRPFDVYASENPIISVAIAGLGLSDIATESAVRSMPPDISFIISPYAAAPDFWVKESRQRGHEVWLTLPVESENYPIDDPGPHTMLIGAPERENHAKMEWLLTRADGYIGFVTNHRPAFMKSLHDMRPVIGGIYSKGLAFVDGSADPSLVPQTMAAGMKAPYSTVDIWIDAPDASQASITNALKELEQRAYDKGYAVGVIHALPVSYQQVLKWIDTLPDKKLTLAPLSATTGY